MASEPTILVKKKDGTQVRMTLSEFKIYKESLEHTSIKAPEHNEEKMIAYNNTEKDTRIQGYKDTNKIAADNKVEIINVDDNDDETEKMGKLENNDGDTEIGQKLNENLTEIDEENNVVATDETPPPLLRKVASPTRGGEEKLINNLPTKIQTEALATTTPVKDIFIDEAVYQDRLQDSGYRIQEQFDHRSLLDDESGEDLQAHAHLPVIPNSQDEVFNDIMKRIKFPVADEILSRLRSLIISRLKDIRTDDQVFEYAIKKAENGGLGLKESEARELIEAINVRNTKTTKGTKKEKIENEEIGKTKLEIQEELASDLANTPLTPLKGGINGSDVALSYPPRGGQPSTRAQAEGGGVGGKVYDRKPILQDVTMPEKKTVDEPHESIGPIDELKMFTLTDFRRLALKPEEAIKILQDKFTDLRAESYIFYLKGKIAWRESPLYQEYLQIIKQAIDNGEKIDNIFAKRDKKNNLSKEEFKVLVGMMQTI